LTLTEHYTFGDGDHVALRMLPCTARDRDPVPTRVERPADSPSRSAPAWLERYYDRGFQLVFWPRMADPTNDWKGPRESGWTTKTYAPTDYREGMQVGVKLGTEIAPGRFLFDGDLDWAPGIKTAGNFLPTTGFIFGRKSKPISHALYTSSVPIVFKEFNDIDGTHLGEIRGTKPDGSIGYQTVLPPSLHRESGDVVTACANGDITHDDSAAARLVLLFVSWLLGRHWPKNGPNTNQHDTAAYAAGFLCHRGVDPTVVPEIVGVAATLGGDDNVPDRVRYAKETVAKFQAGEKKLAGGPKLAKEIGEPVVARLREWLSNTAGKDGNVNVDDFYAYMPMHSYLFVPSREFWPATSVNARIFPIPNGTNDEGEEQTIAANVWLDRNRAAEQMTWAPGLPLLIRDRLVADGGWIDRVGCACINLYRPPQVKLGDARLAGKWLDLVRKVYPEDANHLIAWFAHRVQRPHEKINHGIVLGGSPGIGKDSILEPVKAAVGPWNFAEVSPPALLGRFNGFAKSVILRISEARDLGDANRYDFYEHMKVYLAAPPDVLRVDEKNLREHSIFNVCGPVITTNHPTDGLYLPPDDRRHYVTWSTLVQEEFTVAYWNELYAWYANGGTSHVAAYLTSYNLSKFDAKAPPKKTEAFWAIVDANRSTEDAEIADLLDELMAPLAVTLTLLADTCPEPTLALWLKDRKNIKAIPHRLKTAGYVAFRNGDAKDGMWKIQGKRQVVYVKQELSVPDRQKAVKGLG